MKRAALLLGLLLVCPPPAWCYRFDCSRSCTSSCGSDLICQIQCHTCCPAAAVKSPYLCGACRGSWQGSRCSTPTEGGQPPAFEPEPPTPAKAATPPSDVGSGYEDVDVIHLR